MNLKSNFCSQSISNVETSFSHYTTAYVLFDVLWYFCFLFCNNYRLNIVCIRHHLTFEEWNSLLDSVDFQNEFQRNLMKQTQFFYTSNILTPVVSLKVIRPTKRNEKQPEANERNERVRKKEKNVRKCLKCKLIHPRKAFNSAYLWSLASMLTLESTSEHTQLTQVYI